jgi:hypothetical protein
VRGGPRAARTRWQHVSCSPMTTVTDRAALTRNVIRGKRRGLQFGAAVDVSVTVAACGSAQLSPQACGEADLPSWVYNGEPCSATKSRQSTRAASCLVAWSAYGWWQPLGGAHGVESILSFGHGTTAPNVPFCTTARGTREGLARSGAGRGGLTLMRISWTARPHTLTSIMTMCPGK